MITIFDFSLLLPIEQRLSLRNSLLYFLLFLYIDSCLLFYIASQIVIILPTKVVRATTIAIAMDGRAIDIDKVVKKKSKEN